MVLWLIEYCSNNGFPKFEIMQLCNEVVSMHVRDRTPAHWVTLTLQSLNPAGDASLPSAPSLL